MCPRLGLKQGGDSQHFSPFVRATNSDKEREHAYSAGRGGVQVKFSAASMLPVPTDRATWGDGHTGRVRSSTPAVRWDAMIWSGAIPCSTQRSSAVRASNTFGPGPPVQ